MENDISRRPLSIAVVDDHPVFRKILSRSLARILPGCEITEADNGEVFLEHLKTHTYDLVLMDVKMPVMNGIEATSRAIREHPELKILALSMHNDPDFLAAMKNAGASGYLIKGSDQKKMKNAIQQVLQGNQYFCLN
jgi:DNA-binding NarL/FixJ family response regulator